jgi:hypothetical protein
LGEVVGEKVANESFRLPLKIGFYSFLRETIGEDRMEKIKGIV